MSKKKKKHAKSLEKAKSKKKKSKQIERVCKNCKLYNPKAQECSIVVLHEGNRYKVPMEPKDKCLYETEYFDPTTKAMEDFADNIEEVKFWVEDEKGRKTKGNGTVKMEYPKGFFGKEKKSDLPDLPELAESDIN